MSSQNSKILHFHGFLLSQSYKVSAKKVQKSYLSWHWRVKQSLKKNWLVVSNIMWGIWWIFTQPLQSLKISFRWALFVQSIQGLNYKNLEVIFHETEQWCKIVVWPRGFKNGMRIWVNFHWSTEKSEKLYFDELILFQLEKLIGIMCHDTEGWCKV